MTILPTIRASELKIRQELQLAISGTIIGGFIEDSTATLYLRNYYFMRDFSDIQGPVGFDAPVWG